MQMLMINYYCSLPGLSDLGMYLFATSTKFKVQLVANLMISTFAIMCKKSSGTLVLDLNAEKSCYSDILKSLQRNVYRLWCIS